MHLNFKCVLKQSCVKTHLTLLKFHRIKVLNTCVNVIFLFFLSHNSHTYLHSVCASPASLCFRSCFLTINATKCPGFTAKKKKKRPTKWTNYTEANCDVVFYFNTNVSANKSAFSLPQRYLCPLIGVPQ